MDVTDAGSNSVIRISRNGKNMSVFAKFPRFANPTPVGPPMVDPVPTGIVAIPNYGGFLVTTLTGFPFLNGKAGIYRVDRSGNVSPYLLGLTLLTDIAMDKFRNIYVAQFGRFSLRGGFAFGSGQVVKIRNGKIIDTVATGYGPGSGVSLNYYGDKFFVTSLFTGELFESGVPSEAPQNSLLTPETRSNENNLHLALSTYPNPATDFVVLKWTAPDQAIQVGVELVDMAGKAWYQQNNLPSINPFHRIQLNHLAPGNYLVKLKSKLGTQVQKISINR